MKLHLPVKLFHALLTAIIVPFSYTYTYALEPAYDSGVVYGVYEINTDGNVAEFSDSWGPGWDSSDVIFSVNSYGWWEGRASAFAQNSMSAGVVKIVKEGNLIAENNAKLIFSNNHVESWTSASASYDTKFAVSSTACYTDAHAESYSNGGAMSNFGVVSAKGNGDIVFENNRSISYSSASATGVTGWEHQHFYCTVTANAESESLGGAIYNEGAFELIGNGSITFQGNEVSAEAHASGTECKPSSYWQRYPDSYSHNCSVHISKRAEVKGGAIYNSGTFSLSGNENVLFEKNTEISNGSYRLRSIYSTGTLNLSASEGKSILFKDSVYASGTVNLNQNGTGDIIFTGATTESDLREVKGGVAGTAEEILNSRTSEIATNATLYGGRLIVEDGAILKGQGLTLAENSHTTLRVNNGVLDQNGSEVTINSGTKLEAQGGNTITASSVNLRSGSELSFVVSEENRTKAAVTLNGTLNTEAIIISLNFGNDFLSSDGSYALLKVSDYDASAWTSEKITIATHGVSFDDFVWRYNTLYYHFNEPEQPWEPDYPNGSLTITSHSSASDFHGYSELIFRDCWKDDSDGGALTVHSYAPLSLCENGRVSFVNNFVDGYYDKAFGGAISCVAGEGELRGNGQVNFSGNSTSEGPGNAIYNSGHFSIIDNGDVNFNVNRSLWSGAISNRGTFILSRNEHVTFSRNGDSLIDAADRSVLGGAIFNNSSFSLCDNRAVTFIENYAASYGGAIYNYYDSTFTLRGNGNVSFIENLAHDCGSPYSYGGAIYNDGTFTLSDNGSVTFRGNTAYNYCSSSGGAIYNWGTFTLSGNGDVLFEKNAEISGNIYRLRSIYSTGTLNLSASEGKSILFKDSVYASGTVNLNQNGTGDIIFTGATTESDLREVKGGVAGTAQEILNSRTSEIATNATLYGGRLMVEDGAILKGRGITFAEGADATIRLNGSTLDETGYAIAVSSGSGLEFEGENTLAAARVSLADNSFLNFILDEAQTAVNWNANLDIQGGLSLNLTHEDKPMHDSYALLAMQSGNIVTGWDDAKLSISGTTAEHLVWENNTLYYRPMLVQENGDTTLDKDVDTEAEGGTIGGKDDVSIDGNGHTLNVKNEVQLVQMALKNGTVKLEGENNGIVSVTLTEGGELVLTAGAGLKTGDIISMVANGKGELVISGDITLDNKGMKGKAGEQSTLSHANAQVLGDATISNVRMEDSVIDLAEGSTVGFDHVVLAATTRITDDPATMVLDDVTAELVMGVNASLTGSDLLLAGTSLAESGNTGAALTLAAGSSVVMLEATTFDSVTLTGTSLVLELAGMDVEIYNGTEWIAVSFTGGTDFATFDPSLAVTLSIDGVCYESGYTIAGDDGPTTMYFRGGKELSTTPEPATATLSLFALAALAARRRRK